MSGRHYELRFDGSCWPNPGGKAGYGWQVLVHDPDEYDGPQLFAEGCGPVPISRDAPVTNNVAEWHALRVGLAWVTALRVPVGRLLIRGDSQLVVNQLTGDWGCNKPHLDAYRAACRGLLDAAPFEWDAAWIPREENAGCDALSLRHGAAMPEGYGRR